MHGHADVHQGLSAARAWMALLLVAALCAVPGRAGAQQVASVEVEFYPLVQPRLHLRVT